MRQDYHQLLKPEIIKSVEGLALISKVIVDGYLAGHNHSRRVGSGMEFSQFRSYQPGDDLPSDNLSEEYGYGYNEFVDLMGGDKISLLKADPDEQKVFNNAFQNLIDPIVTKSKRIITFYYSGQWYR